MAISTIGAATSSSSVALPVGGKKAVKQAYSSLGSLAYTANLPAGSYLVNCTGNQATNLTLFGNIGSTNVGGTAGQTTSVITTSTVSGPVSLYACNGVPAPAVTQTQIATVAPVYGWVGPSVTQNHLFKFKGRIYTCANLERGVWSIPDNVAIPTVRTDYIGTTFSNQMSEGAASENVAVITSTGPNTNAAWSSDGNSWTTFSAPFSSLTKLLFGANLFLAFSQGSTTYYTSTDGPTWTARTLPVQFRSILWDGTIFLAAPFSASSTWYQSTDGITWTTRNMSVFSNAASFNWNNIEFVDGFYVAYFSNAIFYTSSLATNWTGLNPSGAITPYCAQRWFGNLVFFDGAASSKPPYSWLIPPATTALVATATSPQMCGAAIDALGRLVTLERTASNLGTFRVSSAGLLPALFTIATTDAEVAN